MTSKEFFEAHLDHDILELMEMYRDYCVKHAETELRRTMARNISHQRYTFKDWEVRVANCLTSITGSDTVGSNFQTFRRKYREPDSTR